MELGEIPKLGRNGDPPAVLQLWRAGSPSLKSFEPFRRKSGSALAEKKKMGKECLFLDLGSYVNSVGSSGVELSEEVWEEIAGVYVEQRPGPVKERVNPFVFEIIDGEPNFSCETDTVLGRAEVVGLLGLGELVEEGFAHMAWLSPPWGISLHKEGRLVVVEKVEIGSSGEMKFYCWGIPLPECTPRGLLLKAWRLVELGGETLGELGVVGDLRKTPIGFEEEGDIGNLMEEVFGMPEVWEAIRQGEVVARKNNVVVEAKKAWDEMMADRGGGRHDLVVLGAEYELRMEIRGFPVMAGGVHGRSNAAALLGRGLGTAFDVVFGGKITKMDSEGNVLTWCNLCNTWYLGKNCPHCN